MRNVVYGINISIDGCFDHTFANPDEEIMEYFTSLLQSADVVVYGRKTYELMIPYWPDVAKVQSGTKAGNEFAQTITAIDKIVFSKTLDKVEGNSRIVRDKLEEEIRKLKQQPGKKISIGGVNMPSQLIGAGLVDEFCFVVHPVMVGKGAKLFDVISLPEKLDFKLVDSKIFRSGAVGLHYLKQ